MQQQYGVILGDNWLSKHKAVMDFGSKTCIAHKHGCKYTLTPTPSPVKQQSPTIHSMLLNATQVMKLQRHGYARSFTIKVSDSGLSNPPREQSLSPQMQQLIAKFQDLTQPRTALPPVRNTAHTPSSLARSLTDKLGTTQDAVAAAVAPQLQAIAERLDNLGATISESIVSAEDLPPEDGEA